MKRMILLALAITATITPGSAAVTELEAKAQQCLSLAKDARSAADAGGPIFNRLLGQANECNADYRALEDEKVRQK